MNTEQETSYGNIYNKKNVAISKTNISQILAKCGIKKKVSDITLWQRAFIHNSYSKNSKKNRKYTGIPTAGGVTATTGIPEIIEDDPAECMPIYEDSNEKLEFLGDGLIQSITTIYLCSRYPTQDEGFLTKLRSKLVKTESLSKFAKYLGMEKFLVISKHIEENCNGRANLHILEDAFEAFIGAMFLYFSTPSESGNNMDSKGFDICRQFIITVMEDTVDFTDLIMNDDNYKDQLMRFYQKNFSGAFPIYQEDSFDEATKMFCMSVAHPVTNKVVGKGRALSKKKAEQLSAKQAIHFFGI